MIHILAIISCFEVAENLYSNENNEKYPCIVYFYNYFINFIKKIEE